MGRLLVCACWLVCAACGGHGVEESRPDAGTDASSLQALRETACRDWAGRLCSAWQECSPAGFAASFSSLDLCTQRKTTHCLRVDFAPGAYLGATDDPRACLDAYDFSTCSSTLRIFSGSVPFPTACGHGAGADGAPCWYAEECAGQVCFNSSSEFSGCGHCGHFLAEGAACSSGTCGPGLFCDGTCKPRGETGAACTGTARCMADLACVAGKCGPRLPAGADCSGDDADPCVMGTACNPKSNLCVTITTAGVGQPCRFVDGNSVVNCTPDAGCQGGTATGSGTCVPRKQDGEACSPGDGCVAPAVCFQGKCTIVASGACEYPAP